MTRRVILKNGALAVVGMSSVPQFLSRAAMAATAGEKRKKILVTVFLRGGADGLNMVVPFGDKEYAPNRPSIGIAAPVKDSPSAVDLNGFFGLHPGLQPLLPLYKEKRLAVIHAVGLPIAQRSHFDAQDYMESGSAGDKSIRDGWLNRYLATRNDVDPTPFRAVAMGSILPRVLRGPVNALAVKDISEVEAGGAQQSAYASLYDQESNSLLQGTAKDMYNAVSVLQKLKNADYQPAKGANYPRFGPAAALGASLRQIAQMIKADTGVEVAAADMDGWDTHGEEGNATQGRLTQLLRGLSGSLVAFYRDLGDRAEDVVILTMTEFGRTVRENGSGGTDHGRASVMFAVGGPVKGGEIYGNWPGLAPEQLEEKRDLAVTTDFRDVFGELLSTHMRCDRLDPVFPGHKIDPARFKRLLKA